LGLESGSLIRLDREVYGLVSGMSSWRATVVDRLLKLGYRMSVLDPCLFYLHLPDQIEVEGLLVLEVDDTFSGGGPVHDERMKQLRGMINFGCWHGLMTDGPHDFAGRRFEQVSDFGFRISMGRYIREKLSPIHLSAARKDPANRSEPCNESEKRQLRAVNGALGWVARQCRPDECASVSLLQSSWSKATVQDVVDANASIRRLQRTPEIGVMIMPMPLGEVRTVSMSDAGNGGAESADHHSQGGFLVGYTTSELNDNCEAPFSLASWSSHKIKRKVESTLHGESLCLSDGLAEAEWCWNLFREAAFSDFDAKNQRRANDPETHTPTVTVLRDSSQVIIDPSVIAVVDAKSIFDHLVRECTGGQCRRTALVLSVIRESMRTLCCRCRWVPHHVMPCDGLTKRNGNVESLIRLLSTGRFRLTDEKSELVAREAVKKVRGYVPRPHRRGELPLAPDPPLDRCAVGCSSHDL